VKGVTSGGTGNFTSLSQDLVTQSALLRNLTSQLDGEWLKVDPCLDRTRHTCTVPLPPCDFVLPVLVAAASAWPEQVLCSHWVLHTPLPYMTSPLVCC
jgi:hypothetical protein